MDDLVDQLVLAGVLRTPRIIAAMRAIDRGIFVPEGLRHCAYRDEPLSIGYGQTTLQPSLVAFMLELLAPRPGESVRAIGSGSGYTSALLAEIVGPQGHVSACERVPELAEISVARLAQLGITDVRVEIARRPVTAEDRGPYERILVSAALRDRFAREEEDAPLFAGADPAVPAALLAQLAHRGVLVAPTDRALVKMSRTRERFTHEVYPGSPLAPLV